MKKLLGLLGTIMITGNAIPSVVAAAPNRKHSIKKRQNNENTSTTPKTQDDQQSQFLATSDNKINIIEKEVTLNENYSESIQKMLQELIDENYIDPLRNINMGGLVSKELDNKPIISKLEELEPKMANWFKNQQNNKDKILILTLKNSNSNSNSKSKSIKLVINLNNFYLLGFINNQNQYFYFDDELLKRIEQINQNEITELTDINADLEKFNKLTKEKKKDNTEKEKLEELEWKIKEKLNKLKELDKLKEQVKLKKNENNIKNIDELIKEQINKAKDLNKLNKELIEARKAKLIEQINETNQKIEKLKEEILIPIPAINYNNDKKYLNNKIKNLQGEGLKTEEIKTKTLNTKVSEKYNCQKINLNYTGAYSEDGLDVVIKEKDKPTMGKDIILSKDTLNNAIANLANYNNKQNENIKNDLVRLIFVTSEAMRFQCDEKTLEIFVEIRNIDELKKIIADIKNILKNIQEKIFIENKTINWKDYTSQLRGDWKKYSEQFNKFRIEIWEQLIKEKNINDFFYKNKFDINKILTIKKNDDIKEKIENLLKKSENQVFKKIKKDIKEYLEYIIKIKMAQEFKTIWKSQKNFSLKLINPLFYKKHEEKLNQYLRKPIISIINSQIAILCYSVSKKNLDFIKLWIILNPNSEEINDYFLFDFSLLHQTISDGNNEIIREILKHPKINVNIQSMDGMNPLLMAVMNNNTEITKLLLENHKINVNIQNQNGSSALFAAIMNDNIEIIQLLFDHKADVNILDKWNYTPLHWAAMKGNIEIVKLLLANGSNINAKGILNLTPMLISNDKTINNILKEFAELKQKLYTIQNQAQKKEIETKIKELLKPYTKNKNNKYDVPADGNCLFWNVATAYLLPVRNNNKEFKTRFIQLFGEAKLINLLHIQKLLQQLDLENHSNNQLWYNDEIAIRLVTNVFRNRVVDYIQSHLDTISTYNGELTFRDLIQENNEIANNYLERMRQPSTWGGLSEIIAMANILNANISVNNDAPYQPINQNSTNTINIFHVNNGTHYNFVLLENVEVNNTNSQEKTTTVKNQQKLTETEQPKTNITISNKSTGSNNNNVPLPSVNKQININIANSQETTTKKAINKYNSLSKEEKQKKLNEINQHYQNLSENDKKVFKNKLKAIGTTAIGAGISAAGAKITISGSAVSAGAAGSTGEAIEMTPLLSEGLTAAETLSVAEGTAVVATEGAVIGSEAGAAAALAPETLGLSLVIGGLAIAGTAIIWWLSGHNNTQAVKHASHNEYNEIEKYYKFLAHDQLKLDITINEWNKIKQIYKNANNYQEFKNKIKSEITNFHKEDHSGWGGSLTDDDINTLINIIYNHFQEINNHFSSNPNHGWKIVTNTIGSYFIIEEE